MRIRCLLCLALLAACAACAAGAATPAPPAASAPPPKTAASQTPAPIPLADIAARAEALSSRLRDVQGGVAADQTVAVVSGELPELAREIDERLREHQRILAQRPPLDMLQALETGWRALHGTLAEWTRELARSVSRFDRDLAELQDLEQTWTATRAASAADTPAEVLARIDGELAAIRDARAAVERARAQALAQQGRVAAQDARIADAIAAVKQVRSEMVGRLLVRDSVPIWDAALVAHAARIDDEARLSLSRQGQALRAYVARRPAPFIVHALLLALAVALLHRARAGVRRWSGDDAAGRRMALVFETPLATALVLSLFFLRWLYPQAPRMLWALFGAAALIPALVIMRRLMPRELWPTLYVVAVFYFVDQVRAIAAALQLLPRALLLVEMLAGALFAAWVLRAHRTRRADDRAERRRRLTRAGAALALALCLVTLLAGAAGYSRLASLVGNAALTSAYLGLLLYVMVAILDGLAMVALRVPPLAALGIVQRHRAVLRESAHRLLHWIAFALWLLFLLERLTVRERVFAGVRHALGAQLAVGSIHVSLGDVLAFVLTIYASVLVSRLVGFLLEEDVYPRVNLARGLPYAISTMTHYLILVIGFLAAVAALGFDMTKFTILAGAFTVGVGFGLQNIFNNFVSGVILLFERPVKVGDVIDIDNVTGVVERIGIRASIVRAATGAELIVPNGKLISDRFTNWTYSSRKRSVEVPVSIVLASDAARAIEVLERTAAAHPLVAHDPPPKALVTRLGPDWMGLELRAWTEHAAEWMQLQSDLYVRVSEALAAAKIAVR